MTTDGELLWQPDAKRVANANMTSMMAEIGKRHGTAPENYDQLQQWSVDNPEDFWTLIWDMCDVRAETRGDRVVTDIDRIPGAKFFPDARLNFAQNLLRRRDDTPALIFRGEDKVRRQMTWRELYDLVSRLHKAMKAGGVVQGDRVVGFMPNMPETIAAMLAATSLGAIWSSCSPDFGIKGVLDRFGQIGPKMLITADGYFYAGKTHSSIERMSGILAELPDITDVIVVPYTDQAPDLSPLGPRAKMLGDFIADHPAGEIDFQMMGFNDPLYIMYSSGTTGLPKCIVHSVGGVLMQHLKEHRFHNDLNPGDRLFYFTTCGWMMWNWLTSALANEVTLLLYDGSPFHPDGNVLFDYIAEEKADVFGTSAKFIDACLKAGLRPGETHDLSRIRAVLSTGSPLSPDGFDYVYETWGSDLALTSMSGGTDVICCFNGGSPISPIYKGEIQKPMLGMRVQVFDDDGNHVVGQQGELVCTNSHPSLPIEFWGDTDGSKYHDAYFDMYDNVWRHGDWVEMTPRKGLVIYGRSDATLNPGGVRIGTAEIYRQVEALEEVIEGLVIGQSWDNDTRVVLFVRLADGITLDDALQDRIRTQVRQNATPRHVPARIVQVADIPRTLSGKIVELAVRNIVHKRPVKNRDALANPEALDLFADLPELQV